MSTTNDSPADDRPAEHATTVRAILGVLLIILLSGCGPVVSREFEDLQQLGLAYYDYTQEHDADAPAGWDDLVGTGRIDSETIERLRGAGVVVNWGINFHNATNGAANSVLAYPEDALASGGYVLKLDGAIHRQTASELKEMLASQASRAQE
jgi:hypothetical protein